jgi:hypothetical protein
MTTKLTLTIEKDVIETAKSYAQKKGRSLSGLVENYLKSLSGNESDTGNFSPKVKRLLGAIKLPDDFDYKETLGDEIEKKYGK